MRIALDVDGVVSDWEGGARKLLFKKFGYTLPPSPFWDYIKFAIKGERWKWLWREAILEEDLFYKLEPLNGAIEGIDELQQGGHKIQFLTSRATSSDKDTNAKVIEDTNYWLDEMGISNFIITFVPPNEKWLYNADLYVDDKPSEVRSYVNHNKKALLFSQPWNVTPQDPLDIKRIYSWDHLLNYVKGLP